MVPAGYLLSLLAKTGTGQKVPSRYYPIPHEDGIILSII